MGVFIYVLWFGLVCLFCGGCTRRYAASLCCVIQQMVLYVCCAPGCVVSCVPDFRLQNPSHTARTACGDVLSSAHSWPDVHTLHNTLNTLATCTRPAPTPTSATRANLSTRT